MASNTVTYTSIGDVRRVTERTSHRGFFAVAWLLFAGSAAVTIGWCESMSAMGGMPMPGGWTMSMAWMRMPGETWLSEAASFLGMWMVMMIAMMLPSLTPALRRYRQTVGRPGGRSLDLLTALMGMGYFLVWGVLGGAVFVVGDAMATLEMGQPSLARAVPVVAGAIVLVAGALQFSAWRAHHLACWREADVAVKADAGTAWRNGLRRGMNCVSGCAGWTAILLVLGVMDWRVMTVVTVAITAERLGPGGEKVARTLGGVAVAVGLAMMAQAMGIG